MAVALSTLKSLFAYSRWANAMTLESVEPLTPEEWARPIGGSFGSVQGTLVHLAGADWVWLERLDGRSPRALPSGEQTSTLNALRDQWNTVQDAIAARVSALTPERLEERLTYVNFAGETWTYPVGEALLHLANHGTYHRGQVVTLLRQLGKKPVATDYLRWIGSTR